MSYIKSEIELNAIEKKVYEYIKDYIKNNSYSPTIREIGAGVGLSSTAYVHGIICTLKEKGYVEYGKTGASRTLHLVDKANAAKGYTMQLPVRPGTVVWAIEAEMLIAYKVRAYLIKEHDVLAHLESEDRKLNRTMTVSPEHFGRSLFISYDEAARKAHEMIKEEEQY